VELLDRTLTAAAVREVLGPEVLAEPAVPGAAFTRVTSKPAALQSVGGP